jgi:hypothetical protein
MWAAVQEYVHPGIHSVWAAVQAVAVQQPLSAAVLRVLEDLASPWAAAEDPGCLLVCCCVLPVEAVGGLSVGLKCLCGMGLLVASMLPLPPPTLAVSILV